MDDIYVGRLMTSDPITVAPETPIVEAAETMLDNEVSSLLVTDADGHLVGILTSTDFVHNVADEDADHTETVESHMTTDVITVGAQDPIGSAADQLIEHGVHHLPVVDDVEGLVGILSTTDLTGYLSRVQSPSPS